MLLSQSHATFPEDSLCQTHGTSPWIKSWKTLKKDWKHIKWRTGFATSPKDFHSPTIYFKSTILVLVQKVFTSFKSQRKYQVSHHAANVMFIILSDFWPDLSGKLSPRVSKKKVQDTTSELFVTIFIAQFRMIDLVLNGFDPKYMSQCIPKISLTYKKSNNSRLNCTPLRSAEILKSYNMQLA